MILYLSNTWDDFELKFVDFYNKPLPSFWQVTSKKACTLHTVAETV